MSATGMMPNIEPAMQNLVSSFAGAWNKHDAKAMASHFMENGDLINPAGRVANGRKEIETLFQDEQSSRFKTSRMNMTISRIRTLTPDIVILTNNCELSGVQFPTANEPQTMKAIATFVLQNDHGTWRIVSARPMVPAVAPN